MMRVIHKSPLMTIGAATLAVALTGFGADAAAAPRAHHPAQASKSPSLAVTLDFIRDKVAQQGQLAYASSTHDPDKNQTWDNQFTVEASSVTSDTSDCSIGFHWHSTVDGKQAQDMDSAIPFKVVTSVGISSMDDDVARLNAKDGHAAWVSQMRPAVWVLLMQRSDNRTNTLDFHDRDMAERVAKAIRHAADLCGGTKSMPF
jgi:hypothetical protein